MNTWHRYQSHRETCPVCNGDRKDCRQNLETSLIHCRSDKPNLLDYVSRGSDKSGFNMWAFRKDADDWKTERNEEWQREQQQKKEFRQKKEREELGKLLPLPARDKIIRNILPQLSLSSRHRKILRARGLSDEQIDQANYRSVVQWQGLSNAVSNQLSGVKIDGLSLINHTDGILIAVPNGDGLYTHLRVNDLTPDTPHKYYPLSSAKRGIRYHLASGEQPVAVYYSEKAPEKPIIGFTEGLEYKPLLAASKLGIPVIGASGGNFASSSKAVSNAINAIQEKYGWGEETEFVLYADAGSGSNPNVVAAYEKLGELIPSLKIADWGQLESKENGLDIDEIDPQTVESKLIPIAQFVEKAKVFEYRIKCRKAWIQSKEYTPDTIVSDGQKYLNLPTPKDGSLTFIKAGLGTGKTTNLIKWLKEDWADYGAINLGYRNTLLIQFCEKSGFTHIHDDERGVAIWNPQGRVAACINSHYRFKPEDFDDKILILDEVVSIVKSLLFSNTIRNRGDCITLFFEAIKRSKAAVFLDGNLSDPYCNFITQIDPTKTVSKIQKIDTFKKPELELLEGVIKSEKLKKRDHTPWLFDILTAPNTVDVIASDSQTLLECLDEIFIKGKKLNTLRVDSKTINEIYVKEFLADPVEYLRKNKVDKLLFSPSCESGLDVNVPGYFDRFFGIFFGKLDPEAITQIIARVRDSELKRYLWVAPFVKNNNPEVTNSPLLDRLKYHYQQRTTRDIHQVLSGETSPEAIISELLEIVKNSQESIESNISLQLQASSNYEQADLRECVYWLLSGQGYDISNKVSKVEEGKYKPVKKQVSEVKAQVKEQNAKDIFNASNKYIGKDSTRLNFDASWSERCAVMKAKLIDTLPGINDSEVWSWEFVLQVKYESSELITQLENRYLLENLDKCRDKNKVFYNAQLIKGRQGKRLIPWKMKSQYQQLKALHDVGILDLIKTHQGEEFELDSPVVTAILAKSQQKQYWQALGKKPGTDSVKYLRWLLGQVGYGISSRKLGSGERQRVYQLSPCPNEKVLPYLKPIMDAIIKKYSEPLPELTWGKPPQSSTENALENGEFFGDEQNPQNPDTELDTIRPDHGKNLIGNIHNPDGSEVVQNSPQNQEARSYHDLLAETGELVGKLGWSTKEEAQFIFNTYGKRSRHLLDDEELLDLLEFLKAVEFPFKVGDRVILTKPEYQGLKGTVKTSVFSTFGRPTWWYTIKLDRGEVTEEINVNFLQGDPNDHVVEVLYDDVLAETEKLRTQLGWTNAQGSEYLRKTYGTHSRQLLSDGDLLGFLDYLRELVEAQVALANLPQSSTEKSSKKDRNFRGGQNPQNPYTELDRTRPGCAKTLIRKLHNPDGSKVVQNLISTDWREESRTAENKPLRQRRIMILDEKNYAEEIDTRLAWIHSNGNRYLVNVDNRNSSNLVSNQELLAILEDLRHFKDPLEKGDRLVTKRTGQEITVTIRTHAYKFHSRRASWWYSFELEQGGVTEEVQVNFLESADS